MSNQRSTASFMMLVAGGISGALLFSAASTAQVETNLDDSIPRGAILAFAGECPRGWVPYLASEGRVLVGRSANVPQTGGNAQLLASNGVALSRDNIPSLTVSVQSSATANVNISQMGASSSDSPGSFLFHNNPDIFFLGVGPNGRTQGSRGFNVSVPISLQTTVGNSSPTRVNTVMPYISVSYCVRT